MTKNKHPVSKYERKVISEKKNIQRDGVRKGEPEQRREEARKQRIYKKLTIESLKEKETENELRIYKGSQDFIR